MRKLCFLFAAVMTAATVWWLAGCNGDGMKNVSERRSGYYSGGDDVMTVTAVSGVRERNYVADGTAGELVPYTLITIVPSDFDVDAIYTYTAKASGSSFGGTFVVHPFAASFSAEFSAETVCEEFTVTVNVGGQSREYALHSLVTDDMIEFDEAVSTAIDVLGAPDGKYEVRARLIKNPLGGDGVCWHVGFYTESGDTHSVLLDAVTAKTLAKK